MAYRTLNKMVTVLSISTNIGYNLK